MSDEESHSESEFYYPKEEEQAKTEQNNMSKVTTHGDESFGNSQQELQNFVQEQKSENTVNKTSRYEMFLPFSWRDKQNNDLLRAQADVENYFQCFLLYSF